MHWLPSFCSHLTLAVFCKIFAGSVPQNFHRLFILLHALHINLDVLANSAKYFSNFFLNVSPPLQKHIG
jgi:hypothetical protein